jgi:hypothetical protein
MLNSVLGNMHELARSLMMGTTEKRNVGNGLIIKTMPLFAYKYTHTRSVIENG